METDPVNILYPLLALFALTAFCAFRLGYLRFTAVRRGEIDPRFFKLYNGFEEPDQLRAYSRHLVNLFEAPILFYVIVLIAFVAGYHGLLPLCLAWAYVALRYAHSAVHLTSNNVLLRFRLFALSWLVLAVLWLVVFTAITVA
jgi:hypothetical protein